MGVGEVKDNPKALESAMRDMGIIAGQKPVATVSSKSIAAFKLREGMKIGCKVTSQMAVFLINSRLGPLSEARNSFKRGPHFSRSYVRILPSSLARVLSCALDFSSRPPVSVCGTVRPA